MATIRTASSGTANRLLYPQVMLGVLNYLKNENEQKDNMIAELKPKAMALESLQRHEGLFGLTEVAKILEMQPKQFILFL